ncbi:response regulator [Saprospira sp. CCB-QB6]|uniref:response regulator n=1 Tax=Saprospira sp. CCB-QB6 TaxID=3023936 RepID=UPI002349C4D2|nr:response regulator [Saprospira sp. CCB-QB6]WCL80760.1 response regulator [Saprospira sp. CCB-QB6]
MKKKVLIVDDSLYMRSLILKSFQAAEEEYEVVGQAANGEQAIDLAMVLEPDLITLDNILPDMIGSDILEVFQAEELPAKVIMISAVGQESVIQDCLKLGAAAYLVKPFTPEELLETANKCLNDQPTE